MRQKLTGIVTGLLASAVATAPVGGQAAKLPAPVTRASYDRARTLLDGASLVRNLLVTPHWIGDRDEFWYRRETTTGTEFVVVEAATGRRRPAFDHAAVATALSSVLGRTVAPNALPIDDVHLADDGRSLHVTVPVSLDSTGVTADDHRLVTTIEQGYDCRLVVPVGCTANPAPLGEGLLPAPNGRLAVFERGGNLWLRELDTGAERSLTRDGRGDDLGYGIHPDGWKALAIPRARWRAAGHQLPPFGATWSPDSRTVIVTRLDQRHVAAYPFVETVPADGSFRPKPHAVRVPLVGERPPSIEWYTIDVASGAVIRLAFPYEKLLALQQDLLPLANLWWGPGGRHLYAAAYGDNMESAFLFDADLATGRVRTVIDEAAHPRVDLNSTSYNPPDVYVTSDGREAIWWSQRDGWGHLYRYDVATGRLLNRITSGPWLVRDLIKVDETRRVIYFTGGGREGGNPYYRRLYRVGFDGGDLELLSPEPADAMLTGCNVAARDGGVGCDVVSPSGRYVVYGFSTPSRPTEHVIRRTEDDGLVDTFERADASRLFAAGFRPPEEFVAPTADGRDSTWDAVYRPDSFDSTASYPVIDVQYASPMTAVVPRNFLMAIRGPSGLSPASYAALGFVAVVVDGRGTTYRSREFTQSSYGRLQVNGLDDHVAAIRALGHRRRWVDTTRVGIVGGSYGGWSTVRAMLEFPDFFQVGVAQSPPGAMHTMYLDYHWTAQQGRPVYSDGSELRPTPTEVPANWRVLDGRQLADRLKGHLLLITSELDENVVPGSTMPLLDALMRADRDFDLIYLPDTPHMSGRYASYVTRRQWDYFVQHLKGETPPKP